MKRILSCICLILFGLISISAKHIDYNKYIYPIQDKESDLYGFVDLEGNMIIPCQFDKVDYDWSLAYTCLPLWIDVYSGDKKGYVNMQTREMIAPINKFKEFGLTNSKNITYWFRDGSRDTKNETFGIYDPQKDKILFQTKGDFHKFYVGQQDYYPIRNSEGYLGVVDCNGKLILPFKGTNNHWGEYEDTDGFMNYSTKKSDGKYEYNCIDLTTGKEYKNRQILEKSNGLFIFYSEDKVGVCDKNGKTILPAKYKEKGHNGVIYDSQNDMFLVCDDQHNTLLVDKKNQILARFEYDKYGHEVKFGGKGIIILGGYEDGHKYYKGYEKYTYVDFNGKNLFGDKFFRRAYPFERKYANVKVDNDYKVIDLKGNIVLNNAYIDTIPNSRYYRLHKDEKEGLLDEYANTVFPAEYKYLVLADDMYAETDNQVPFNNEYKLDHLILMYKDDMYGYSLPDGKVVVPCNYRNLWDAYLLKYQYLSKNGVSDIDVNIPYSSNRSQNLFALVIANENYKNEENVNFAHKDGEIFRNYLTSTLGISDKQVKSIYDATNNDIHLGIDWLKNMSTAYKGNVKLIVYYAGHGIPNESDRSSYLLPVDGKGSLLNTCYSLSSFYSQLGQINSEQTIVFMDACFSGAKRGEGMLTSTRGVAVKTKTSGLTGNVVALTASQGDETAHPYKEQKHGLFTYFLLKKIKESKGNCNLGDLMDYLSSNVLQTSMMENGVPQTPSIITSTSVNNWQSIKLK